MLFFFIGVFLFFIQSWNRNQGVKTCLLANMDSGAIAFAVKVLVWSKENIILIIHV